MNEPTPRPAIAFMPSQILKAELQARGWTQQDLALLLGRPARLISELMNGKRSITAETAYALGEVFGTGGEFWLRAESFRQLQGVKTRDPSLSQRSRIFGRFPVREMQYRGWLPHSLDFKDIERSLCSFFGIPSLDDGIEIPHVAKKTDYDKVSMQQAAWLKRAQHLAPHLNVSSYDDSRLEATCEHLRHHVRETKDAAQVPEILAAAGIRFLVIEPLPGSKIDAACMWFDGKPLVVLSLRYDRHDIFWHALFHELDHIKHGEGRAAPIVDSNMMSDCSEGIEAEQRANAAAAARLIPPLELERLMREIQLTHSEATILRFAERMKVHPGIVVGQLQHHSVLPWSAFTRLKSKIRETLRATAFTDGFAKL